MVALVSSLPFSVAVVGVRLVAGAVTGAASATMVARCASIASIEHSSPVVDAVRAPGAVHYGAESGILARR